MTEVRHLAGRRLPIARASLAEARRLDAMLPDYRQLAAARGTVDDLRTATLTAEAATEALVGFLDHLGVEASDRTALWLDAVVGMLTGLDAGALLGMGESVATSPAALAIALNTLLRTETRRPPPAAILAACRDAEARLDKLDAELLKLDLLRDDVDSIRDQFDPDAPPLPPAEDGFDDTIDEAAA
ncbi:hypothetical protein [Rhodoplanes azumiensis]|uniref:Uncharacterized protein n=1 Tax=Rhodoplanes azumiensis TaxID=1897628 RepID=A0ABW5AK62_9BRAD